ncbi:MAG: DUF2807 domain-containing protein [Crocinitomicaceae bacterium]
MKKLSILFLFVIPFLGFSQEFWSKKLSEFSTISIQGRMQVVLASGDEYKVEANIHGDNVDIDKLVFIYKDSKLSVRYQGGAFADVDLILTFYLPKSVDIEVKEGVELRMKDGYVLKKDKLMITAFAGGKIAATVASEKVTAEIHQGGSIRLSGSTTDLDCHVFTGGTIATISLKAKNVTASVAMGGEIITTAEDNLDAKVTSGGTISYKGEPKKKTEKITLGGKIEKL